MKSILVIFQLFVLIQFVNAQPKRASQYVDLVPMPPATLKEARERLSPEGEDMKVASLLHEIETNGGTAQPFTIANAADSTQSHPLSARSDVDYALLAKSIQTDWEQVEDSTMFLLQNPKFSFQNTIVTIGEDRVKALSRCKNMRHRKGIGRAQQDSLCEHKARSDARNKRDAAADNYLSVMQKNWTKYKSMVKTFALRQEHNLDSVKAITVKASDELLAKRAEATLIASVKLMLQYAGDMTKMVMEAGAQ